VLSRIICKIKEKNKLTVDDEKERESQGGKITDFLKIKLFRYSVTFYGM
jgi:hypothetical protein